MRSKFIALVLGCGVAASTLAPAFACMYQSSNDSSTQTAQSAKTDATQTPAQSGVN